MAETLWNFTTTVQSLCKQQSQPQPLSEIPRNKLRLKESFGRGCLGEVSQRDDTRRIVLNKESSNRSSEESYYTMKTKLEPVHSTISWYTWAK